MSRHKVNIEIMIEGLTKEQAIQKAQKLCEVINAKDKNSSAWVKQMIVKSNEEIKDTSILDLSKF
jgi:hypothetical protein